MDFEERQHITIARLHKTRRLVAILDAQVDGDWNTSLAAARRFTDEHWLGLGIWDAQIRNPNRDLSTVMAPSPITRRMVIDALEERLRIQRIVASKPAMTPLVARS